MTKRFKTGDRVLVRRASPVGHVRTPSYLKGKRGIILRNYGAWKNPEQLSKGNYKAEKQTNYWVQFTMDEIWGGDGRYAAADTVVAELYEHWLEPAPSSTKGALR